MDVQIIADYLIDLLYKVDGKTKLNNQWFSRYTTDVFVQGHTSGYCSFVLQLPDPAGLELGKDCYQVGLQ